MCVRACDLVVLRYTIRHCTVLIIFLLFLQAIVTAQIVHPLEECG